MAFVQNKEFDEYVDAYKKLNLQDKKKIVEQEIQELMITLEQLNLRHGLEGNILYNREILDLKSESATEADFVEGVFVYINSIKELLASYAMNIEDR